MRDASKVHFSEAQQRIVCEGVMKYSQAVRYHVKLMTESGEPAGSGVCVMGGGRRGLLTARHVLFADDEGRKRLPNPVVVFMPPRDYMLRALSRHDNLIDSEGPFLGMPMTGISLGDRETIVPLQRPGKDCPDPGLPDIAVIAISDSLEERLREAAAEAGTLAPEPEWLDLDTGDQVGVQHSMTNRDEMLRRDWVIAGVRSERSGTKKIYSQASIGIVDRIYRRSEYEYYGIFVDEVHGSRARSRSWKGTSGGGVWQQRLTKAGLRKVQTVAPSPFTPEDLAPPVLGGIAFYHETRKTPEELRDSDGKYYRSELYAHRIDEAVLGIVRRALGARVEDEPKRLL